MIVQDRCQICGRGGRCRFTGRRWVCQDCFDRMFPREAA